MPWIVMTIFSLIFGVILVIAFIIICGLFGIIISIGIDQPGSGTFPIIVYALSVAFSLIWLAFGCYFFIVVWSFRFLDIHLKELFTNKNHLFGSPLLLAPLGALAGLDF